MQHRRPIYVLFVIATLLLAVTASISAAVRVRGYFRRDGTYVQPHYRSNPDHSFSNNWSTKGNINPYTGSEGTRVTPAPRTYTPVYNAPAYTPPVTTPRVYTPAAPVVPKLTPSLSLNSNGSTRNSSQDNDAYAKKPKPKEAKPDPLAVTVHITRTGKKYHAAGCRYLARSDIPISKREAIRQGYTACSVCNP